ncbi:MAG: DUF58 domain-containing protein [Verrucomicrobia bacterium]|nr:DUF58 domain-containing protein [Verrucomicrobiota bacterium]MCH8511811.1 DUF58 domain-containing protein [Kiritimatiellia bacterium]
MTPNSYLDPAALSKIGRLDLRAKLIVEGFMSGMHRSPFHGFSVEFAQYRGYVPGDDTKHIDWRVYAKSGRYTVKQFEEETNLTAHILIDASGSMAYRSSKAADKLNKLEYAKLLTACLSHLILGQSDAAAVGILDTGLREFVEPSTKEMHLQRICGVLERTEASSESNIGGVMSDMAVRMKRRGIVMLISDLFDEPEKLFKAVSRLRHRGQEVVVFHLLDETELSFPFEGQVRFRGLEGDVEAICRPRMLRELYLKEMEDFILQVKTGCRRNQADYVQINTRTPMDVALSAYLVRRMRVAAGRSGR